jgi:hypothetical protein
MEPYTRLQVEIRYLTALIALIFKRPPESVERQPESVEIVGDSEPVTESPVDEDSEDNEILMPFDETEFEDEPGTPSAQILLDALKRKALDRLAEVLARFKTPRTHRQADVSGHNTREHLDAKHVTAVVLVEDVNSVAIVCAKNEGVDPEDVNFLQGLGEMLKKISRQGM